MFCFELFQICGWYSVLWPCAQKHIRQFPPQAFRMCVRVHASVHASGRGRGHGHASNWQQGAGSVRPELVGGVGPIESGRATSAAEL